MSEHPILVRDFKGTQSMQIICESCGAEAILDGDQLLSDGYYRCPKDCGGAATYKYESAPECPGCKRLGFWERDDNCCSRACQLQKEYAEGLSP